VHWLQDQELEHLSANLIKGVNGIEVDFRG
jgi:hypothetical protein